MTRPPGRWPIWRISGPKRGWTTIEREAERAVAELGVGDGERARRQPARQRERSGRTRAGNSRRCGRSAPRPRRATVSAMPTPKPTYSSRPVGPAKRLAGMDDLRKAAAARIEPRPDLAAARGVLGDGDDGSAAADLAARSAAARRSAAPPAPATSRRGCIARLDRPRRHRRRSSPPARRLREAPPDRERQAAPVLRRTTARGSADRRDSLIVGAGRRRWKPC